MSWRDLPLRHKLAALLLGFFTLPTLVLVGYDTLSTRDAVVRSAQAQNLERATSTARAIHGYLDEAWADVRAVAGLPDVVSAGAGPAREETLRRVSQALSRVRSEQDFLSLIVTDRTGRVLAATDERAAPGQYRTDRAFLIAIAGTRAIVGPERQAFDDRVALTVAHAVRGEDGQIVGTVRALIDMARLEALIHADSDYAGRGESGVLLNAEGMRLSGAAAPREPVPAANVSGDPFTGEGPEGALVLQAVAERGRWLLYDESANPFLRSPSSGPDGPVLAAVVPMPEQRWIYAVLVPEAGVVATYWPQAGRNMLGALLTAVLALVLSLVVSGWVSTPLRHMTTAARALQDGDLTRRIGFERRDEFGQLASAFDQMAASLAAKDAAVRQYTSGLEHVVAARTESLQRLEEASRILGSSLDVEPVSHDLVELLVPDVAGFCAIDVLDGSGLLRRIATAGTYDSGVAGIHLPLSAGSQDAGTLVAAPPAGEERFGDDKRAMLEEVSRRLGLFLANARLYQSAREANRLKDEFLAVVSHELRTPLHAIMGWTRVASLGGGNPATQEARALAAVERNTRALAHLVDDLLDVQRILTGKLTLDKSPIELRGVVQAAVDTVGPAAAAAGLDLRVSLPPSGTLVHGDASRLQQVFGNLLANAVKFTPEGGTITVTTESSPGSLRVSVADTGAGIAPEFLPHVFDRFRQADSSTTRRHGGLGIGLSIVRHIVELHGGEVEAESAGAGKGSTFRIALPPFEPSLRERMPPFGQAGHSTITLDGLHLLVVDDDEESRDVLVQLLLQYGARVEAAASADEALQLLEQHHHPAPSVVLTDISMPQRDGFWLLDQIRRDPSRARRRVPVVALTAFASAADRTRILNAGFDEYASKPVDVDWLAATVARLVSESRGGAGHVGLDVPHR